MIKPIIALVLASLGACEFNCEGDHGGTIRPPEPVPEDARLGTRIVDVGASTRFFFSPFYGSDRLYVLVYLDPNFDEDLAPLENESVTAYAIDPATLAVTRLPDPPLTPSPEVRAWRALDGAGFLAGVRPEAGEGLAFFDGSTWTSIEPPPGYLTLDGNILARAADDMLAFWWDGRERVVHWDGSSWEPFGPDPAGGMTDVGVMSWEGDQVRFVHSAGGVLCTQIWSVRGDATGSEDCFTEAPVRDIDWNTNGTLQTFQLFAQSEALPVGEWQALVFDGGVFSTGLVGALPATTYPAPGSRRVITLDVAEASTERTLRERVFLEAGLPAGVAIGPFEMRTQCECNRSLDIDCPCVVRSPIAWAARFHPDASRAALFWLDQVDARRQLFARVLDLPATEEPYATTNPIDFDAGPPVCSSPCDPGDVCIFNSLGEEICVPFDMVPEGGVLVVDASRPPPDTGALPTGVTLLANVRLADDTLAEVTIEGIGGPAAPFTIEDEPTGQVARLSSFVDYRVSFSGPEHWGVSVDISTEGFGTTIDLGGHVLIRGVRLGDSLGAPPDSVSSTYHGTTVSPNGDVLLTATTAAWNVVRRSGGVDVVTPIIGVTPRVVDASGWESSTFTPDGAFALVDTTAGLSLLRIPSGAVVATLPGGPYDLGQVSFADAAPVFSVRTMTTHMPTGRGETSVVRYGAGELTELLRVPTEGWREHVRADGAEMARIEGAQAVVYDVGTGARAVVATVNAQAHVMVTFDGRAVVAAEPIRATSATLRRRCWTEPEGCRLRIVDRVVPGVSNVGFAGGFHVAATANIVAWQEIGQVGFYDVGTGIRSVLPIAGVLQSTRLGVRDRLVALGSAGPSIIDLPTRSIVASGPAGRVNQVYRRVDGAVFLSRSAGCVSDCQTLLVDPTAASVTLLAGANGVIAGEYTTVFGAGLSLVPTAGGSALSLGGGSTFGIDRVFFTALAHGASCMVFDVVDFEPQLTTGLYCAP